MDISGRVGLEGVTWRSGGGVLGVAGCVVACVAMLAGCVVASDGCGDCGAMLAGCGEPGGVEVGESSAVDGESSCVDWRCWWSWLGVLGLWKLTRR